MLQLIPVITEGDLAAALKGMDCEEYLPPSALDHHMGEDCCYFYILSLSLPSPGTKL